ncbi:MAG: DNA cytosine methyltransferase [Candidatus Binataceae bacterium]
MDLAAVEICAGGGGQALGLETAGFHCVAAADIDGPSCETLRLNRPHWRVLQSDIRAISGREFRGIDLFAGGVPCPPFSIAGKQLGRDDERDLFPQALRIIEECQPAAILLENVPGLASERFKNYRRQIATALSRLGYEVRAVILNACDYRVPQLRPRLITVGLRPVASRRFVWPEPLAGNSPSVGEALADLMASRSWAGALAWVGRARGIAPTIVGGSKKHGGPDLGPTRARRQWAALGVDGLGIADSAPPADFPYSALPRLTVRMVARLQGFPDTWHFAGKKTAAYRQVGNAFPPPVAAQVGLAIVGALVSSVRTPIRRQASLFA